MSLWTAIKLIITNWSTVLRFLKILERGIEDYKIKQGLERLDKSFGHVESVNESANQARSINDLLR
jgi:hypothetical protein